MISSKTLKPWEDTDLDLASDAKVAMDVRTAECSVADAWEAPADEAGIWSGRVTELEGAATTGRAADLLAFRLV